MTRLLVIEGDAEAAEKVAKHHVEAHLVQRMGWLRAAVLGANGIISTSSLILGVASAAMPAGIHQQALIAGFAGLVAGAMSMAAGEYVSVSSQADTEAAGSLLLLAALGMVGARAGGAGLLRPTIRVVFWGALAMAITTGIGALIGKAV